MQTAIDWLIEQLIPEDQHEGIMDIIEDAKQREKQQIIDAFDEGSDDGFYGFSDRSEQYYNENYGSKGSDENFKQFSLYEHKETIATADTPTSSQTEISDEEIEKGAIEYYKSAVGNLDREIGFRYACKWYREQLKKK